jgi:hypothetical protein
MMTPTATTIGCKSTNDATTLRESVHIDQTNDHNNDKQNAKKPRLDEQIVVVQQADQVRNRTAY